ncbi:potassium/proton antiporter [Pseudochryseolinea flava]|uniref:Potassium/proton antiporter n=1 Tax=Pseudochryseolinea flava TaxID=2059302 RepID=A0A364Y586_9BACT|nr:potassium/proton antiporter [Pseudochryseolinea flava]RAW01484.1 potassium/proton antiporter [Pseudochryseolinea flava]
MIPSNENILLVGSILLFVSILASKTSFRFGIPVLIFFLIIGMLAGSEGPGGIYFNDPHIAKFLGVVALTFILFSGGLDTKWGSVKPVLKNGIALATLGVLITASVVGIFSSYLLDISLIEGLLIGAIVSSTDAAAVFSILRSHNIGLKGNIRPLLEFESGSNDPMAYFLTTNLTYLVLHPEKSMLSMLPTFFISMAIGAVVGYGMGRFMNWTINRIKLEVQGLYPVLMLSLVFFTFSFTDFIGGNGFLAVYLSGLVLGNSSFIHKKSMMKFYDGQAWVMQIIMFVTLGLLVFPSNVIPVAGKGILIAALLIFVARPLAVFISLAFSHDMDYRKKLFISWVGLRGAVPIVFATYPLIAGMQGATMIFNLVFFISLSSVLLQGTTLPIIGKWLRVSVPGKIKRKFPLDIELNDDSKSELIELDIMNNSASAGKAVVDLKLPPGSFIVLIHREGKYFSPNGQTVLSPGDHLLMMADRKETVKKVHECFKPKLPPQHA